MAEGKGFVRLRNWRFGGISSRRGAHRAVARLDFHRERRRMAEGEGFEPPVPFRVQWFSRPPPSTTRPSLPPSLMRMSEVWRASPPSQAYHFAVLLWRVKAPKARRRPA